MLNFPKLIYELQAISINIPAGIFERNCQANLSGNVKTTLKKNKVRGLTVINMMQQWWKDKWNTTEKKVQIQTHTYMVIDF